LFPGRTDPEYKEGMKLAKNYLQRQGYRLPTEAEMEYATRAGAQTARYYGETEELLDTEAEMEYATRAGAQTARYYGETEELLEKYAWYAKNGQGRSWPVGSKKPNDLGMFDMQGNVYTWCQERYRSYAPLKSGEVSDDKEDVLVVRSTDVRVLRGGSFSSLASLVRSANRYNDVPTNRNSSSGFRPARTLPPGSFTALPPTAEGGRKCY
jgi:formylglycine-generating enzyme required for sulfatase activity